uniref:Uncharacterized protein n=1 Tax=Ciona intestinalis TaxID=7719 RepID=H2XZA6_CIOIN
MRSCIVPQIFFFFLALYPTFFAKLLPFYLLTPRNEKAC